MKVNGKRCPLHAQILYETDSKQITLKSRGAGCSVDSQTLPGKYAVGEDYTYELAVINGVMTFKSS